jgi:hypothetical protein
LRSSLRILAGVGVEELADSRDEAFDGSRSRQTGCSAIVALSSRPWAMRSWPPLPSRSRGPCGARDPGRCRELQLGPRQRRARDARRVEARTSCRTVHRSRGGRRARLFRRHCEYRGAPRTSVSRRRGDRVGGRGARGRNGSRAGGSDANRRNGDVARRQRAGSVCSDHGPSRNASVIDFAATRLVGVIFILF